MFVVFQWLFMYYSETFNLPPHLSWRLEQPMRQPRFLCRMLWTAVWLDARDGCACVAGVSQANVRSIYHVNRWGVATHLCDFQRDGCIEWKSQTRWKLYSLVIFTLPTAFQWVGIKEFAYWVDCVCLLRACLFGRASSQRNSHNLPGEV